MGTVPFPLFHGTSSHYLELFRPGTVPGDWPYGDAAISLLGETWAALREFGREPDWWVERTLNQVSGPANWQHGELYLTPSRLSAARYAVGGAIYGGEFLTMCRNAVDMLFESDGAKAERLLRSAGSLAGFLEGDGSPMLVEFANVRTCDLLPERKSDDVPTALFRLDDESMRELLGQQTNFRLVPGCGTVVRMFHLETTEPGNPLMSFDLKLVCASELRD